MFESFWELKESLFLTLESTRKVEDLLAFVQRASRLFSLQFTIIIYLPRFCDELQERVQRSGYVEFEGQVTEAK